MTTKRATLAPGLIHVDPRTIVADLSAVDQQHVKRLREMIRAAGLLHPPTIFPRGNVWMLAAGRHRLAALIGLPDKAQPFRYFDSEPTPAQIRLVELTENATRRIFSPSERAEMANEIDALLASDGINNRTARDEAIAQRLGVSTRTVRELRKHERTLGRETLRAINGTSLDAPNELAALCGLPSERRADLIMSACNGGEVSAVKALSDYKAERFKSFDAQSALLTGAWGNADAASRLRFLRTIKSEIAPRAPIHVDTSRDDDGNDEDALPFEEREWLTGKSLHQTNGRVRSENYEQ